MDWMSIKWPENDLFSQPGVYPYINHPEVPFNEPYDFSTDWNPSVYGAEIDSSFTNSRSLPPNVSRPTFGNDSKAKRAPLYLDLGATLNRPDQSFSEDVEDGEDGDLLSDVKSTPAVTPSTTAKNSFLPTW